jgi:branched-chain amino acid aminotransferase
VIKIGNLSPQRVASYSLAPDKIEFGRQCTPNFVVAEYRDGKWSEPRIEALHHFSMHPASNVFQYGQAIFEGLKAYRQPNDQVVLFRPEMNAQRFEESAIRMGMPPIGAEIFLEASRALVDLERPFIPESPGTLYLRPTMIGTEASLGVRAATEFLFYIITLPSGAYFKNMGNGTGAVRVFVEQSISRAAPGGTGEIKAAANYAVTLKSIRDAKDRGCSQVLFLDAERRQRVEELGGMNVFFVRNGKLITPRLNGTILPGVTRASLLTLGPDLGVPASEEDINIDQVVADVQSGVITEAMACGTAATVVGISELLFSDGRLIRIGDGQAGTITKQLFDEIQGIQFGRIPDRFGWTQDVSTDVLAVSENI